MAGISGRLPGGMRRHMELHARGLRESGVAATTLYREDALPLGPAGGRMPGAALLVRQLPRLRRERPDVVNVHTLAAPAWLLARRAGLHRARVIVMSYAADERGLPPGRGARAALRRARIALPARALFPGADGIWCVNAEDAAFYEAEYRVPRERIAVIPHAIADAFFVSADTTRDWSQVLFVGTWIPRKGSDVLERCLPEVLDRLPGVRVVLAGTLAPEGEVRERFPPRLQERILVYPRLDDAALRELYGSSGLLLVPSRLEGLPFSLLEGLACGCPALAAANSGMRDVVDDEVTGWLLGDLAPDAWARRVVGLLEDEAARRRASAAARVAAERFRLPDLTRRALAWYESLR